MVEKPVELNAWRDSVQTQITEPEAREYVAPIGPKVLPTVDRPLLGAGRMLVWLKRLTVVGAVVVAIAIVLAVFAADRLGIRK